MDRLGARIGTDITNREFDQNGYTIVSGFWHDTELDDLQHEIEELGRHVVGPTFSMNDAAELHDEHQSMIYDRLHYLPALSRLSGSKRVRELCREFGLQMPWLMGSCNMRLDRPRGKHLFDWHQDTLYLLGSVNAVTLWFPLGDADLQHGTIQVIPGSHRNGIYPFRKISDKPILQNLQFLQRDLCIDCEIFEEPATIVAKRGDAVIFKQMLLHRSTPNISDVIRWTGQLRITDLGDPDHKAQRFPTGDKTNIYFVRYPRYDPARSTTGPS
jgi:hypothetical protein